MFDGINPPIFDSKFRRDCHGSLVAVTESIKPLQSDDVVEQD